MSKITYFILSHSHCFLFCYYIIFQPVIFSIDYKKVLISVLKEVQQTIKLLLIVAGVFKVLLQIVLGLNSMA